MTAYINFFNVKLTDTTMISGGNVTLISES